MNNYLQLIQTYIIKKIIGNLFTKDNLSSRLDLGGEHSKTFWR